VDINLINIANWGYRKLSFFIVPVLHDLLILPDATGVVLRASNYGVTLVIEGTGEYIVFMAR
jgi:hypothetical protein